MTPTQSPDAAPAEWPQRFMDELEATQAASKWFDPIALATRCSSSRVTTHIFQDNGGAQCLWVDEKVRAYFVIFRDSRNYSVVDCHEVGALRVPETLRAEQATGETPRWLREASNQARLIREGDYGTGPQQSLPSVEPAPAAPAGDEARQLSGRCLAIARAERPNGISDDVRGLLQEAAVAISCQAIVLKSRQPAPTRDDGAVDRLAEWLCNHYSGEKSPEWRDRDHTGRRPYRQDAMSILALWEGR